jgi:hypothetical protein
MHTLLTSFLTTLHTPNPADPINDCPTLDPTISLSKLTTNPESLLTVADKHLHVFPFKDVKPCWRRLYTDASIVNAVLQIQQHLNTENRGATDIVKNGGAENGRADEVRNKEEADWVDEVVRVLDMAVIMTGVPGREDMVEKILMELQKLVDPTSTAGRELSPVEVDELADRPTKRRKVSPSAEDVNISAVEAKATKTTTLPARTRQVEPDDDPDLLPLNSIPPPRIHFPIPRMSLPTLSQFESHLSSSPTPSPSIITSSLTHWPALTSPHRSWRRKSYLLSRTLGGRRLVPVEIGSSYTSSNWSQRIMQFKEFLSTYITPERDLEAEVGYLAQHHLLSQIPLLRPDISIPDYVYTDPPPPAPGTPVARSLADRPQAKLDEPIINTWFGPAWTVSPLHHDPWHGLLCQVMGRKYVRLYAPEETEKLYPRGMEGGVDMGNTSRVDVERYEDELRMEREMRFEEFEADDEEGDANDQKSANVSHQPQAEPLHSDQKRSSEKSGDPDEDDESQLRKFPLFRTSKYVEAVLDEGEMLHIPVGWWHYVRSLSTSWSVSFWWN